MVKKRNLKSGPPPTKKSRENKKATARQDNSFNEKPACTSSSNIVSNIIPHSNSKSKQNNSDKSAMNNDVLDKLKFINPFDKPFVRDIYYAYLINGARRTKVEGYPIIEGFMVADKVPDDVIQWDQKSKVADKSKIGLAFYNVDNHLMPLLNNPLKYLDEFKQYAVLLGMDASPYDNMPPCVQKSQIFINLSFTYFFGNLGIKVIPNVRIGTNVTYDSLEAYPHNHLISIGTNGFIKGNRNRNIFLKQIKLVTDALEPSGIVVYGYDYLKKQELDLFEYPRHLGISIYQYDSCIMKRNAIITSINNKLKR